MSRRDLSVKGGTSERCYRTRRGRSEEQWYAIISPYFDVIFRGRRDRVRMMAEITTTYALSAYHHLRCEFESRSWRSVLDTTLYEINFVSDLRQIDGFLN
jgi:hypothetical protein